jgi:hypothetical protein
MPNNSIAISAGHGKHILGATPPYMDEVTEARRVCTQVVAELKKLGVIVRGPYFDDVSTSQNENLNRITDWHNSQQRQLDVSVHFNANAQTSSPMGTECLFVSQSTLAGQVAEAIANAGKLKNRGGKKRTDLFFLNNTDKPAILIEVCFVDSSADKALYNDNFNAICAAIAQTISGKAAPGPSPEPPTPRPPIPPGTPPTIGRGDKGDDVENLQAALGVLIADGDFGSITETWVKAFQAACGLTADGIVGPLTWEQVDDLEARGLEGEQPLPQELRNRIVTMAKTSEMFEYSWPDRGVAPEGYISGMCLAFAYAVGAEGTPAVNVMSRPQGDADKDALAWYEQEFKKLGMSNKVAGTDTLRHLFVMQTGLGPRESSGRYFEGRDMTADNVEADTCEAGLFQTSWNIRNANSTIGPLLDQFWNDPNGFLDEFQIGLSPTANNLNSYGTGDGVRYQFLSRFCPLFHIMVTAVGLRTLRQHWGPVNRREVTLKKEMDDLLKAVQDLVESEA